jgi:hypothetical protein
MRSSANDLNKLRQIYWREMIMRIHLACCAPLLRHGDWLNALLIAVEGNCIFGAYAACRGFLESAADAFYSLAPVPKTLAPELAFISARIKGKPTDTMVISKELEDRLIHFSPVANCNGAKLQTLRTPQSKSVTILIA